MSSSGPRVSIAMITYNQENYIAQAIESALMQISSFDYEIVIGEDCSTDGTRAILSRYVDRYPGRIQLVLHPSNIGGVRNFWSVLAHCRGDFVALLEGDDYWTSPKKLQKQVDFLDQHPECALCSHNVLRIFEDESHVPLPLNGPGQKSLFTIEEILQGGFIATCSVIFRKSAVRGIPNWYHSLPFADRPLFILCARHGNIGYIDELLGVYRIHSGGLWSRLDSVQQLEAFIDFYERMNAGLDYEFNYLVEPLLSARQQDLAVARRLTETVQRIVPPRAAILVMTKADQCNLWRFRGYQTQAFPDRSGKPLQRPFASGPTTPAEPRWIAADGDYEFRLNFPADGIEAIEQLEILRAQQSEFLLVPRDTSELLELYPELKKHLNRHYLLLSAEKDACLMYDLRQQLRYVESSTTLNPVGIDEPMRQLTQYASDQPFQIQLVQETPRSVTADEHFRIFIRVHNGTNACVASNGPNPVRLAYHWLNPDGSIVVFDGERTKLKPALQPGETRCYIANVLAPLTAGSYELQLALVQEGVRWYDQLERTIVDVRPNDCLSPTCERIDHPYREGFLERLTKDSTGIELGVLRGEFTKKILSIVKPRELHLVDTWRGDSGRLAYKDALDAIAPYRAGVKIVTFVGNDLEYLATLPAHCFDWSYIDSSHTYEQTKHELKLLNAKTKVGGIVAGREWSAEPNFLHYGVYRAVTEFCRTENWRVVLLDNHGQWAIQRCSDLPIVSK